jgi:hypothetical protein
MILWLLVPVIWHLEPCQSLISNTNTRYRYKTISASWIFHMEAQTMCFNIWYYNDLPYWKIYWYYIPILNTVIFDIEAPRNEKWPIPGICEPPDIEESLISDVFSSTSYCFYIEDSSISAFKTYTNIEALCFDIEGASILILAGPAREGLQKLQVSVTLVLRSDCSEDMFTPRGGCPALAQAVVGEGPACTAEAAGGGGRQPRISTRCIHRSGRRPCDEEDSVQVAELTPPAAHRFDGVAPDPNRLPWQPTNSQRFVPHFGIRQLLDQSESMGSSGI